MGQSSSMHVANASSKMIRVRVAQEETRIREIDTSIGLHGTPLTLDTAIKAKLDYSLDVTGFARIAPHEALEFDLPRGPSKQIFVSVTTADDPSPLVICFNYSPPRDKSIIVTDNGTIVLSQRSSKPPPLHYTASASGIHRMGAVREQNGDHMDGGEAWEEWKEAGAAWVTPEGICYTADMARRVHRQRDVDARVIVERGDVFCGKAVPTSDECDKSTAAAVSCRV